MKRQIFVNGKPHYASAMLVGIVQNFIEHNYKTAEIAAEINRSTAFTHALVVSIKDETQMGRAA